jgi:hypothetical protein
MGESTVGDVEQKVNAVIDLLVMRGDDLIGDIFVKTNVLHKDKFRGAIKWSMGNKQTSHNETVL